MYLLWCYFFSSSAERTTLLSIAFINTRAKQISNVVQTFESVDDILRVTIQMKTIEHYFWAMQFIKVPTFKSVDEVLNVTDYQIQVMNYTFPRSCFYFYFFMPYNI